MCTCRIEKCVFAGMRREANGSGKPSLSEAEWPHTSLAPLTCSNHSSQASEYKYKYKSEYKYNWPHTSLAPIIHCRLGIQMQIQIRIQIQMAAHLISSNHSSPQR